MNKLIIIFCFLFFISSLFCVESYPLGKILPTNIFPDELILEVLENIIFDSEDIKEASGEILRLCFISFDFRRIVLDTNLLNKILFKFDLLTTMKIKNKEEALIDEIVINKGKFNSVKNFVGLLESIIKKREKIQQLEKERGIRIKKDYSSVETLISEIKKLRMLK